MAGGGGDPGALDERAVDGPGGRGEGRLMGVGRQEAQRREPGVILARVGVRETEHGQLDLGNLRLRLGGFGGRGCRGRLAVLRRDGRLAVGRRLRGVRRSLTRIRLKGNRKKHNENPKINVLLLGDISIWVNICYRFTMIFFWNQKIKQNLDYHNLNMLFIPVPS